MNANVKSQKQFRQIEVRIVLTGNILKTFEAIALKNIRLFVLNSSSFRRMLLELSI